MKSKTTHKLKRPAAVRLHRRVRLTVNQDEHEIDTMASALHNLGASCAGNTQDGDVEWFARWLYQSSNTGMGSVETMPWSISNEEFGRLGLIPDRQWTGRRWETLGENPRKAWLKLARLCLLALPHIAERIGHRFMGQAKALRALQKASRAWLSEPNAPHEQPHPGE
jgi:hypothetical protein